MMWRGIVNDKKEDFWKHVDTVPGYSGTESCETNVNLEDGLSDILAMKTDDLFGLVEGDVLPEECYHKNRNHQFPHDNHQKSGAQVKDDSTLLTKNPKFFSTLINDGNNVEQNSFVGGTRLRGKAPKEKKVRGYFAPYPQIQILNQPGTSIGKKGNLLPNGSCCRVVKYGGKGIMVQQTCGFDAFVHILQYAALDDISYRKILESSETDLAKFVLEFLNHGTTTNTLLRRCQLLCKFYSFKGSKNATSLEPVILDVKDTLTRIWKNFFGELVACRSTECSNIYCSVGNSRMLYDIVVSHRIICDMGFKEGLPITIAEMNYSHKCKLLNCDGTVQVRIVGKPTIFIELDIRDFKESSRQPGQTRVQCGLRDIPDEIVLDVTYRLIGVIHYQSDNEHFVAYCRRRHTKTGWLEVDDLKLEANDQCSADTKITPFGALYIHT